MGERSELLKDLKEQLKYLREIGVESVAADLQFESPPAPHEIAHSEFETYVPSENEFEAAPVKVKAAKPKPPKQRGELLSDFRLSSRKEPDTKPPDRPNMKEQHQQAEPVGEVEAERSRTLIGDLSAGLPESDETLAAIHSDIGNDCTRCRLCEKRTQVVNSVGNPNADLMFIGEAPGADEDAQGEPFVGRAGRLLTKIIEAIDLKREDVFIGNINRCRPPENRRPMADEAEVCKPFLLREIAVVRPKVIVVLGNTACQNLLDTKVGITRLRGKFIDWFGVKVMPTFHPAYLLRDPRKKREVWEDMKMVREAMNGKG